MVKGFWRMGVFGVALLAVGAAHAMDNPIDADLEGAITSHGGRYYAMDGATNGHVRVSEDLVSWSEPVPILPAGVPGPYDLVFHNGLYYLVADQNGLLVSDDPLKPFRFVRKGQPDSQQARLYQDRGGLLYSVYRKAGSKGEGELWLNKFSAPWRAAGRPTQLLDGRRGLWDSIDSADLGQPEIFHHRGNYYLLYGANNPSPRTGLREVGVAVNENPTRFDTEDKMTDPVLARNADQLAYDYVDILPSGEFGGWRGRYTLREPGQDWIERGQKLSGWRTGEGGFGWPNEVDGAQLFACRTKWDTEMIHIRRAFDCPRGIPEKPLLNIRHEGPVWVYINGSLVYESLQPSISYSNIDISKVGKEAFREQDNVIAVRALSEKDAPYRFIDFGLRDARRLPVLDTVYGLDRPRIFTGPNGFEKWISYQAWWNGQPGTGLDRVFFFDQELYVDGPTTAKTPGHHPPPAAPTFRERFADAAGWAGRWRVAGGEWACTNGVLLQSGARTIAKAYLNREPMANYLFEVDVRFPPKGDGSAGVVAWSDGEMDLIVSVNPKKREWSYHIEPGQLAPRRFRLPSTFQFLETPPGQKGFRTPSHRLRVTKNGGYFNVALDGIDLTLEKPVITKAVGRGAPGLYCRGSAAEFDDVTYTIGWEEHDINMTGWGDALDGTRVGGEWRPHRDLGMQQRSHSKVGRAFKGDRLDQYEFTVNAQLEKIEEGKDRLYGVFPVFIDKENWLKAMIDTRARSLLVTGMRRGRAIRSQRVDLGVSVQRRHLYDKSTAYRDITSWVYELRSESIVNGLDVRWLEGDFDHLRQEFSVPMDDMVIRYARLDRGKRPNLWEDGRFFDADEPRPRQMRANEFNPVRFREEKANFIGFGYQTSGLIVVDKDSGAFIRNYVRGENLDDNEKLATDYSESDTPSRPQATFVKLAVESSYFFRCVKLKDRVLIELNGRPMAEVNESWPPSQVGVITEGQPAYFNGTSLYHIPAD